MGFMDRILPSYNEKLMNPAQNMKLAADITESGLLRQVPNPPNIQPISPITKPISVLSAMDEARASRGRYVDRATLKNIPAFYTAINKIVGAACILPYQAFNSRGQKVPHKLLKQPEPTKGITRSVSMAGLSEDLLCDGASLWVVVDRDRTTTLPVAVERVPFGQWTQDIKTGKIYRDGRAVPANDVRLFVSPLEGLCNVSGSTVFIIHKLQELAAKYAKKPQAREYIRPTDGTVYEADEVKAILQDLAVLREADITGFLPEGLELVSQPQMTPEQMLLVTAQEFAVSEVARLTGLDPTWLGLSTTTRQYSNLTDERRDFLDFVVMPGIIVPIEERLSLEDITPNGQDVKANLDSFLRQDTKTRYEAHQIGINAGFLTDNEARALENRQPLTDEQRASIRNRNVSGETP